MIILVKVQGLDDHPWTGTLGPDNIPSTGIQGLMIILGRVEGLDDIPSSGIQALNDNLMPGTGPS